MRFHWLAVGFGVIAMVVGLIHVLVVPPFQVMDEQRHYLRAVMLAGGKYECGNYQFTIKKRYLDFLNASGFERIAFNYEQKFDWGEVREMNLRSKESEEIYLPMCVLPVFAHILPAVGIWVGEKVDNIWVGFYVGRIINLTVSVMIVFAALIVAKRGKGWLLWIGLLPSSVFLFSSYSYDATVISLTVLATAIVSTISAKDERTYVKWLIWLVLAIMVCLIKPVYLGIFGFELMVGLRANRLKFTRKRILLAILIMGGVVISAGGLGKDRNHTQVVVSQKYFLETEELVSPSFNYPDGNLRPIEYIKNNPLIFLGQIKQTFNVNTLSYLISMVSVNGWGGFLPNLEMVILVWLIGIIYIVNKFNTIDTKGLAMFLVGAGISVIAVVVSMFLVYSPVGSPIILGVQGRYFIPIAGGLALVFKERLKMKGSDLWYLVVGGGGLLWIVIYYIVIMGLLDRYY